jgi:hypothetical protein
MVSTDLNMFIGREDYLTLKEKQEIQIAGFVEKFKLEGLSEADALNKARFIVFKPQTLHSEKYEADTEAGMRPSIAFFFDDIAELNYLRRFFEINMSNQVRSTNKLLHILKFYDENKGNGKLENRLPEVPRPVNPDILLIPEKVKPAQRTLDKFQAVLSAIKELGDELNE